MTTEPVRRNRLFEYCENNQFVKLGDLARYVYDDKLDEQGMTEIKNRTQKLISRCRNDRGLRLEWRADYKCYLSGHYKKAEVNPYKFRIGQIVQLFRDVYDPNDIGSHKAKIMDIFDQDGMRNFIVKWREHEIVCYPSDFIPGWRRKSEKKHARRTMFH